MSQSKATRGAVVAVLYARIVRALGGNYHCIVQCTRRQKNVAAHFAAARPPPVGLAKTPFRNSRAPAISVKTLFCAQQKALTFQ